MGQLTCCSTEAYWCSETVHWCEGSKSCHKETPNTPWRPLMKWPVVLKVPLLQHSGCCKWLQAVKVRWRVFMPLHIQQFHRLVQIYNATLWSDMRPGNLSKDHRSNGWRFWWCGLYGWCNSGWRRDNAWQAKKMWNTFAFACSKFHQYIYGRSVVVETRPQVLTSNQYQTTVTSSTEVW